MQIIDGFALQAAAVSLVVGSLVWVEDPDAAWIDGEVMEINGEGIKVHCTSGKMVSAFIDISQCLYLIHISIATCYMCQLRKCDLLFSSFCHF